MKRKLSTVAVLGGMALVFCLSTVQADDQTVGIYFAKYVPVADLAQSVTEILGDAPNAKGVAVVAEPVSNSLLVRGEPEAAARVHELLKQLDRKPATVFVEAVIVNVLSDEQPARITVKADAGTTADELIAALSTQGELQVLARVQLTAVSNQAAFIHIGARKPRVTGVRESSQGVSRSVELENVGLILGLTPRVTSEGTVIIEADLEHSDLANQEEGVELSPAGDRAAEINTFSLQTTICAKSGQAVILGGCTEGSDGKWQKMVALLTPTIIE